MCKLPIHTTVYTVKLSKKLAFPSTPKIKLSKYICDGYLKNKNIFLKPYKNLYLYEIIFIFTNRAITCDF